MSWWGYRPYVSAAQRRAKASRELAKLRKTGHAPSPVNIDGRTIARTFWGKAWCDHLESYSDFENRLPSGRTYVRNGSVVDLHVEPGVVKAMVMGSELYRVTVKIRSLGGPAWKGVKASCAGKIGSLVELLQGRLSQGVMQVVTCRDTGLFPRPAEIEMSCSCPDWADMCKHVAAVLYGVGARLDEQPEMLFRLRQVDHLELISEAAPVVPTAAKRKVLAADALGDVFGIELDAGAVAPKPAKARIPDAPVVPPATKKTRAVKRPAGDPRPVPGHDAAAGRKRGARAKRTRAATR